MHAASNLNCAQLATASTGTCYSHLHRAVVAHRPKKNMFECCTTLMQEEKRDGQVVGISDAAWIVQQLIGLGYWAIVRPVDAEGHGSWVPRHRAWWCSALDLPGHLFHEIDQFFDRMLACFTVPKGTTLIAPSRMVLDEAERIRISALAGFPTLAGTGPRKREAAEKAGPEWKSAHMRLFQQFGLAWPAHFSEGPSENRIQFDGLREREAESLFFLVTCFDFVDVDADSDTKQQSDFEFLDINHQLPRILTSTFDIEEDGSVTVKRSPWKKRPPTLVGSSKIAVRTKKAGVKGTTTRLLEAVESLLMQGWDESYFVHPKDPNWWTTIPGVDGNPHKFIDLICNMSGNAFSVFHCVPLTLCTMALMGKYTKVHQDEPQQGDDNSSEGEDNGEAGDLFSGDDVQTESDTHSS